MRAYVPGYTAIKLAFAAAGVAIAVLGYAQLAAPLHAALGRGHASAEVVRVIITRPGQIDEIRADARPVPPEASRRSAFGYAVRLPARDGEPPRIVPLALRHRLRAAYGVGDTVLVTTGSDPASPAYALHDFATWAPGGFLLLAGLTFAAAFSVLAGHSRRPIPLPADVPVDAVL
ncbi:MAG: hypothetical protein K0R17_2011 [Rariglobus sp.]|jgi:hypothetical protein|nr:hypothetical protein [Rariglobus sp.]